MNVEGDGHRFKEEREIEANLEYRHIDYSNHFYKTSKTPIVAEQAETMKGEQVMSTVSYSR